MNMNCPGCSNEQSTHETVRHGVSMLCNHCNGFFLLSDWAPAPSVMRDITQERARQDEKWGAQNHPDGTGLPGDTERAEMARAVCQGKMAQGKRTWRDILDEEVREAFAETDLDKLRAELVQVGAVAVAWAECLDRKRIQGGLQQ
ncbi:MAG: hypothetical protein ACO1RX_19975 [Candidatus Sericytochromatia bacterium]